MRQPQREFGVLRLGGGTYRPGASFGDDAQAVGVLAARAALPGLQLLLGGRRAGAGSRFKAHVLEHADRVLVVAVRGPFDRDLSPLLERISGSLVGSHRPVNVARRSPSLS